MDIKEMVWEYIHDEPMVCTNCEDLTKGMRGRFSPEYSSGEATYLFDNQFLLGINWLRSRPGLFRLVNENEAA